MITSMFNVAAVALLAFAGQASAAIDESKYKPEDIITRDVAIIGGGASGAYAAARLRDAGKTVVVIEKQDHLGGHVDTYTDPKTGAPVDFGVIAYLSFPGVREFFERFNVPTENASVPLAQDQYIDFSTGKPLPNFPAFDQAAQVQALGLYAQITAQYIPYTFPSLTALPDPLPAELADLTLPFGDFIKKHGLEAVVPIIFGFVSVVGDLYNEPTAFIISQFGPYHVQGLAPGGYFTPASHNNSQLYNAVRQYLGDDVLLSSHVSRGTRDEDGVVLMVKSENGNKLVKAKKLLVTIPPLKDTLYPFDLDDTEKGIFGKWIWQASYVAVLANTGLPDGLTLRNFAPDTPLNFPKAPNFIDSYTFTGVPGLYRTSVVGASSMGTQDAKLLIRDGLKKIGDAGTLSTKRLDFAAFSSHTPLVPRFGAEDLAAGAYKQAFSLNGRRSTYYTGAAWATDYTSVLWIYTESVILPLILAGL